MPSVSTDKNVNQKEPTLKDLTFGQLNKRFGDPGSKHYGGFFMDEYSPEWLDEKRIETVETMRRGDASCRAALRAIKAPALATKWDIQTDDDTPKGEEIRDFVKDNLFNMKRTWAEFLREALAYLDFGHYVFEIIYEKRDGKVVVADLEPRIPASIHKWKLSDGSFGIVQLLQNDDMKSTTQLEIPAPKCLILTNDKEGDDVTGQSILRSAYKHWDLLNVLYKIQGMAAERFGMGIPVIKLGKVAGKAEKDEAEEMGRSTKSNEANYLVIGEDWDFNIKTPEGNPQGAAIIEAINHHSKQILISVLAAFVSLGTSSTGSFGLSKDQSSFFLKLVGDLCAYLKEQVDAQVIKRLVKINYGEQEKYPYVTFSPLGDIDIKELSATLGALQSAGLILTNSRMVEWVHQAFQLPPLTDDEKEELDAKAIEDEINGMDLPNNDPNAPEPDEGAVQDPAKEPAKEEDQNGND